MNQRAHHGFPQVIARLLLVSVLFGSAALSALFGVTVKAASAPNIINYQGRVLNTNGVPVATGSVSMVFEFYDSLAGGTCIWSNSSATCASATSRTVTLTDGLFSEPLGDTTVGVPYAVITDSIFGNNAAVYLQVTVGGETLSPRKQIVASPYALNSDTLDGMDADTDGATTTAVVAFDANGSLQVTGNPQSGSVSGGSVYINPAALDVSAGDTIFGVAVGGTEVLRMREDGKLYVSDTVFVGNSIDSSGFLTLSIGNLNASGVDLCTLGATVCDTINIGTGGDADTIAFGDSSDTVTLTANNWSITSAGLITTASDLAVNGGDITSTGALAITPASTGDLTLTTDDDSFVLLSSSAPMSSSTNSAMLSVMMDVATGAGTSFIGQYIQMDTSADADTISGLLINPVAAAAGTLYGIQIANVGVPGAGSERALRIGSGYDLDIQFSDTTPTLQFDGTMTFSDSSSNSLISIADMGSVGDLTVTGDVAVNGGDITSTGALALSPGGSGDLTFAPDADSNIQIVTGGTGPTSDMIFISNAAGGTATDGVDAIQATLALSPGGVSSNSVFHAKFSGTGPDAGDILNGLEVNGTSIVTASTENLVLLTHVGGNTNAGGALNGLNIDALSGNSAVENAILLGTGWDSDIRFSDLTPTLTFDGAMTFADSSGNTLMTLTDAGTTGDLSVTGSATFASLFSDNFDRSTAGTVTLGNTNATTVSICSSSACDTVDIAQNSDSDAINIGTDATSADAFNIGNSNAGTTMDITGGSRIQLDSASAIYVNDATGSRTVNIGGVLSDGASTVSIATNATSADTVTIGSENGSTVTSLRAGTLNLNDSLGIATAINIGTGAAFSDVITIGNSSASTTVDITGGDDWSITSAGAATFGGTTTVDASTFLNSDVNVNGGTFRSTSGTFDFLDTVGNSTTIDIGGNTASIANTINIATNSTAADTINIGNSNASTAVNVDGHAFFNADVDFAFNSSSSYTENATFTTTHSTDVTNSVLTLSFTDNAATSAGTNRLLEITNEDDGGATGTPDALIAATNNDANESVTDGLLLNGTGGITNAINASDTSITNALFAYDNFILHNSLRSGELSVGVLTWEDTSGNDLMTLTDTGTTGDVVITGGGTVTNDLAVNGGDITSTNGTLTLDAASGVQIGSNDYLWLFGDLLGTFTNQENIAFTANSNSSDQIFQMDVTLDDDADATDTLRAMDIGLVSDTGDAGDTYDGLFMSYSTSTNTNLDSFIHLNNQDTVGVVDDGLLVTSSAGGAITDAIDVSDGTITNAINVGDNTIIGTSAVINFTGFDVSSVGVVSVNLNNTASTNGICHSGADVDAGTNTERDLVACSAAPDDYAEWYETDGSATPGDIVATTGAMFTYQAKQSNPYTGEILAGTVTKSLPVLTKATSASTDLFGIVSTSPNQVIGSDVKNQGAHPVPVGLVGRVPLHVTSENGPIAAGDYLTVSSTPGYAMKATAPGRVIGRALTNFNGVGMTTITAFIDNTWYGGNMLAADGSAQAINGDLQLSALAQANVSAPAAGSHALLLTGSAWNGSSATDVTMGLRTKVNSLSNYRLAFENNLGGEIASITNSGDVLVSGKLYPSDRGLTQTDAYIFYDSSAGGGYMKTNAAGWNVGSYDFAEMFPSADSLSAGEVVVFADQAQSVRKSGTTTYDQKLVGVVSTRPGFLAGEYKAGSYPIALSGRVPTNVSDENGAIEIGDPLTTSSTPGVAMKATKAGPILGYAMETLPSGSGKIVAFVRASYYSGSGTNAAPDVSNTISGISTAGSLDLSGALNMNGGNILSVGSIEGIGGAWRLAENGDFTTKGAVIKQVQSFVGDIVNTYPTTATERTVQLTGTTTLQNGTATVTFSDVDAHFNQIISNTASYRVLVTPAGATGQVYVTDRSNGGFIIHDTGGSSGVMVDWLVIAYEKDHEPQLAAPAPDPEPEPVVEPVPEVTGETTSPPPAEEPVAEVPPETTLDPSIEPVADPVTEPVPESLPEVPLDPTLEPTL